MIRYSLKEFGRNHRSKRNCEAIEEITVWSLLIVVPPNPSHKVNALFHFIFFFFVCCFEFLNSQHLFCLLFWFVQPFCSVRHVYECVYKMRLLLNWIIFCSSFSSLSNHRISLFNDKNELERFTATATTAYEWKITANEITHLVYLWCEQKRNE